MDVRRAWAEISASPWANALCFAAGALLVLGFAPFYLWPVLFISLPLFYGLLRTARTRAQFLWRSFFFGYGFFMAGTGWIANALLVDAKQFGWLFPISVLGLSAVMALWFVLLGFCAYCLRARLSPLCFAAIWLMVELLRSVGMFGFPWNLVGYASLASLEIAQAASVFSVYGLSFFLVWVALLPVYWVRPEARRRAQAASLIAAFFLIGAYGFGAQQLSAPTRFTQTRLRVVQPNVPQEVKGTAEGREIAIRALGRLTQPRAEDGQAPEVVIWPETAYPFTLRPGIPNPLPPVPLLLTGALRVEEGAQPKIFNSLAAMNSAGEVLATYDKHQLVPFGEFVPLRGLLPINKITPGLMDFSRGAGAVTLRVEGLSPFSPLVCYEVAFPWMAVDAANRPAWILNVTNDGWYGDSPGPHQHFAMAQMRAIEQGLPLVRAANSGISAVIDGRGRVLRHLPLHGEGVIDMALPEAEKTTFAHISGVFYATIGCIL